MYLLWQELPKLKRLDLSYSRKLIRIPDLYLLPDIEEILLIGCESLTEVYSSGFLNKLNCLCLNLCVELRSLTIPSNILWRSSGLILVSGCDKLETFSISNRTEVVQLSGCSHHDTFPTGKGWYYQEYPGWVNYRVDGTGGLCRGDLPEPCILLTPLLIYTDMKLKKKKRRKSTYYTLQCGVKGCPQHYQFRMSCVG